MEAPTTAAAPGHRCRVFDDNLISVEHIVPRPDSGGARSASSSRIDVAEAAVRARVGEIAADAVCVRPELPVSTLRRLLFSEKVQAVSVVDDGRRLIGLVSRTDVLRELAEASIPPGQVVADIMSAVVHGLPAEAPVAYAVSLMAFESLHEIPIVDDDGRVVGMVTALGALRWIARSMRYVETHVGRRRRSTSSW